MAATIRDLVQLIHDHPAQIVLVTAGAGTLALSELLGVSGATRTLLEALVPYSAAAFDDFLGQTPPQYVSAPTAKLMAGRALTRARWLADTPEKPVVGLSCTATIVTDRPKRGEHRAHIAAWQPGRLTWYGLGLHKGARDRQGEETLVSHLLLNTLAEACGLPHRLPWQLGKEDTLECEINDFAGVVTQLQQRKVPYFGVQAHGLMCPHHTLPQVLLPGAFNPLHEGHLEMARVASNLMGQEVAFELSVANVDKPPLSLDVVLERLAQFAGRYPVYASQGATFQEKARLYPGATFVVGYDTARRILQPRYYADSPAYLLGALAEIRQLGCRFLVAGRLDEVGAFHTGDHLDVPEGFEELFQIIPESLFRRDISSTALRLAGRKGSR